MLCWLTGATTLPMLSLYFFVRLFLKVRNCYKTACTLIRSFLFSYLLNAKFFYTTKQFYIPTHQTSRHTTGELKNLGKENKTLEKEEQEVRRRQRIYNKKIQKYSAHSMFSRSIKFYIFAHIVNRQARGAASTIANLPLQTTIFIQFNRRFYFIHWLFYV